MSTQAAYQQQLQQVTYVLAALRAQNTVCNTAVKYIKQKKIDLNHTNTPKMTFMCYAACVNSWIEQNNMVSVPSDSETGD